MSEKASLGVFFMQNGIRKKRQRKTVKKILHKEKIYDTLYKKQTVLFEDGEPLGLVNPVRMGNKCERI